MAGLLKNIIMACAVVPANMGVMSGIEGLKITRMNNTQQGDVRMDDEQQGQMVPESDRIEAHMNEILRLRDGVPQEVSQHRAARYNQPTTRFRTRLDDDITAIRNERVSKAMSGLLAYYDKLDGVKKSPQSDYNQADLNEINMPGLNEINDY